MITLTLFEVKFDKGLGEAGQSQNGFASWRRRAPGPPEGGARGPSSWRTSPLWWKGMWAGPGHMKSQFLKYLPGVWSSLVDQQEVDTTAVGTSGSSSCLAS